jgi:hypothetical protein
MQNGCFLFGYTRLSMLGTCTLHVCVHVCACLPSCPQSSLACTLSYETCKMCMSIYRHACANTNTETICTQTIASKKGSVGLEFNFTGNTVSARAAGDPLDPGDWCRNVTSADPFGHVLWTVNGRVMYRDCTGPNTTTTLRMVLGGPIFDVNSQRSVYEFQRCPDGFSGCSNWDAAAAGPQSSGLDLFAHVDSSGFVYFGDVDVAGSALLFGCSDAHRFGTARTDIEMAPLFATDYVAPASGTLQWASGEDGKKYVNITITTDGVIDSSMYETVLVNFANPRGAFMDSAHRQATVKITDADGPGVVSVKPTEETVGERAYCHTRCESNYTIEQREWVAYVTIERTGGSRGAVCADFSASDFAPNLTATLGVHFEASTQTFCWNHQETGNRSWYVQLTFQGSYDRLHKSFALNMSASNINASVDGASLNAEGLQYEPFTVQYVEDMDVRAGTVTVVANKVTGFSVFQFSTSENTAIMQVRATCVRRMYVYAQCVYIYIYTHT